MTHNLEHYFEKLFQDPEILWVTQNQFHVL